MDHFGPECLRLVQNKYLNWDYKLQIHDRYLCQGCLCLPHLYPGWIIVRKGHLCIWIICLLGKASDSHCDCMSTPHYIISGLGKRFSCNCITCQQRKSDSQPSHTGHSFREGYTYCQVCEIYIKNSEKSYRSTNSPRLYFDITIVMQWSI